MREQWFLGIDGGQSSTTALIGDETGRVLGSGVGGPCNHVSTSESRAKLIRVLSDCVGSARKQAGLGDNVRFRAACVGMSGGPADKKALIENLLPADDMLITDDAAVALTGAMGGDPGVIVIAGTGSIAFGSDARDRRARAGGWGYVFGDEGGAFDIVRQALRAALRREEGWGDATVIREMFLKNTGQPDMNAALHLFYTPEWPRSRVARLAPMVDDAARGGDPICAEILLNAGQQLARLAAAVSGQLFESSKGVRTAYIGGVFGSRILLESFSKEVQRTGSQVIAPLLSPAAGALLEAYKLGRLSPDPSKLLESDF